LPNGMAQEVTSQDGGKWKRPHAMVVRCC